MSNFINLTRVEQLKAHPFRHSYFMCGVTTLLSEEESPLHFQNHISNIIGKNRYERGFYLSTRS